MESLGRFSLEQKVFFNLLFALLIVAGFFAMFSLPTERFPDINMAKVNITTEYPGASPVEVETLVTRKLEDAIENIANIEWISSSSQAERSYIRLKLVDDSDYADIYDEIRFKILNAKADLPPEAEQPVIEDVTMGVLMPVVVVNVGGDHSNRALTLIADQIKASLKKISGVKKVVMSGDKAREFHIYLDPEKLRFFGISFEEVSRALQQANVSMPAGKLITDNSEFLIKVDEKFTDRNLVLKTILRKDGDGSFIRLEQLTTRIGYSYRKPNVITTVNGNNAIALHVIKTPEGNSLSIKSEVQDVIKQFYSLVERENVDITLTQDSTIKINDGLSTLGWNFVVGICLVSVISWYFMGIRNAGLITIGIPFSFLFTMLIMYVAGYSFNELTLFSFVLVSGIIVDDAIVVTENIYRYVQKGLQPFQAITQGLAEVALPVLSSTVTTVAAFLPLLIMSGTNGEFFSQIPAIVCFALVASLFECYFILPVHYFDFGPQRAKQLSRRLEEDNFIVLFFRSITERILNWTLKFRFLTMVTISLLFVMSIGIIYVSASGILPLVKTQFFPDDYQVYFVDIKGDPNVSIEKVAFLTREISSFLLAEGPGKTESAAGLAGVYMNEDYEFIYENNLGLVMVSLPEQSKLTIEDPMRYLEQIREKLKAKYERDGFKLTVHPMKEGPPSGKAINIKVLGSNIEAVPVVANKIQDFLLTNEEISPYLMALENNLGQPKRVFRFDVRHDRVKEYNLSSKDVAKLAGSVLDGRYIGKFRTSDEEIDLKLLLDQDFISTPKQALSVPVIERSIGPILLGDLTNLRSYDELGELNRYQGYRAVSIKSDIKTGAPISSSFVINQVKKYYEKLEAKYPGVTLQFGGEYENTQKSYNSLLFAFFIAVMIIYIVLATQFQSYLQPVIILFAVFFAIIGIVFGKMLVQSMFTVNSFIAMIGVVGVVVNDALVLIDFMNKGYRSGLSRREAIDKAVSIRMRPIILTTFTTILGLLPMALGIPSYSIVWGAMASTFVCGLGAATLLTLWVVPVLWDLIQAKQEKA